MTKCPLDGATKIVSKISEKNFDFTIQEFTFFMISYIRIKHLHVISVYITLKSQESAHGIIICFTYFNGKE